MARFGDSRLRETLGITTRNLAAADTVVHSIDVTGLGGDSSLTRTAVAARTSAATPTNRETLGIFARDTGGRLFDNANDLGPALAEMLEMTSRYYVLGIQPDREKGPGSFHKLKVKVARKGVKLSHRPGYFERAALGGTQSPLQRQFDLAELVMTGRGPRRRALHQPVPAVSLAGREAEARPRAAGAARVAAVGLRRAAGGRGLRLRGRRGRQRARPPGPEPAARPGARRPAGPGARPLGLRDLRGAARPLHDPPDGSREHERQERRAAAGRDGAALRRAHRLRAAAARARRHRSAG